MAEPNPLDLMLGELRGRIIELMDKHQYWEVRIHGSDGIARLETICQERNKYPLRAKGTSIITPADREPPGRGAKANIQRK